MAGLLPEQLAMILPRKDGASRQTPSAFSSNELREKVVVTVGGGPVSQSFADCLGADGYAENAIRAARLAKELLLRK